MTSATVAICTHNRLSDVRICLEAVAPQAREADLPVILVDSASDPGTAVALRELARAHGVRHVRLDLAGVSLARNAAHEHASSDWIVYLDDDAIPHASWARSLLVSLGEVPENVGIVGCRIVPKWPERSKVDHVTATWKLFLSCVEHDGEGLVSEGYDICGANFAVRRAALVRAGLFPASLGRNGECLISGIDSYLIDRFDQLGYDAVYRRAFAVHHRIPPERLGTEWLGRRSYWEGVSRIRLLEALGKQTPAHLYRSKLVLSLLAYRLLYSLRPDPDYLIRLNLARGSLSQQGVMRPLGSGARHPPSASISGQLASRPEIHAEPLRKG